MKSLGVDNVSVTFGKVEALRQVGLEFSAGEAVLLAGPNGAGKSTLLGVLLGLLQPDHGTVLRDGEPVDTDASFRVDVGYLPEAVSFSKNLTGRQVLRFFARAHGVDKKRIDELLTKVSLDHAAGRSVRGYSRGMLQRLGLASAILAEPKLLILDEPTSGLDQEGLEVLWQVVDEWRAAGRILLIASHELTLLERRVDRVAVLSNGRVRAVGSSDELRKQVKLPRTVVFETHGNGDEDTLRQAIADAGGLAVENDRPGAYELRYTAMNGRMVELLGLAAKLPGIVRDIRLEEPGFDVVYGSLLEEEL